MEQKDYSKVPGYNTKSDAKPITDKKFTMGDWNWISKSSSVGNFIEGEIERIQAKEEVEREKAEKLLAEKLLAESNAKLLEQYTAEIDAFMTAIDNSLMSAGILLVKIEKDKLFKPTYVTFTSWLESNDIAKKWSSNSIQLAMRLASNSLCVEFKDLGSGILKALDTFESYVKQNPDKKTVVDTIAEFGEGKALYQLAKDKSLSVKAVRSILDKAKGKAERPNRSPKNAPSSDTGDLTDGEPEPQAGIIPNTGVSAEWRSRAIMALAANPGQEELARALAMLDVTVQYCKEIRNKIIAMQSSAPASAPASAPKVLSPRERQQVAA